VLALELLLVLNWLASAAFLTGPLRRNHRQAAKKADFKAHRESTTRRLNCDSKRKFRSLQSW
jgi:hypothetical protein